MVKSNHEISIAFRKYSDPNWQMPRKLGLNRWAFDFGKYSIVFSFFSWRET